MKFKDWASVLPDDFRLLVMEPQEELIDKMDSDIWNYNCLTAERPGITEREVKKVAIGKRRFAGVIIVRLK